MKAAEVAKAAKRGSRWVAGTVLAVGILDAITLIVLMRLWVKPSDLGIATLATSLSPIFDLLADLGIQTAIVRAPTGPDGKPMLSGVFRFHILVAFGLLVIISILAFPLAAFHSHELVAWLLIGYALKLFIQSFGTVSGALMRRNFRFRAMALTRLAATIADCGARLSFAAAGQPILCFVAGQFAYAVVTTSIQQSIQPYLPRGKDRGGAAFPPAVRFGLTTSSATLLYEFYSNFDYQVVGRQFGESALGLYRAAFDVVLYVVRFVSGVTVDVSLPSLVRLRDDPPALRQHFLTLVGRNLYVSLPAVAGVFMLAPQLLELVFPSYAQGAGIARILAVVGLVRCASALFPAGLHAIGRPALHVLVMAIAAVLMSGSFLISASLFSGGTGIQRVALAWAFVYPAVFLVFATVTLKAMGISLQSYASVLWGSSLRAALGLIPAVIATVLFPPLPLLMHVVSVAVIIAAGVFITGKVWPQSPKPTVL